MGKQKIKIEADYGAAMYRVLKMQDTVNRPDFMNGEMVQPVIDVGFGGYNQMEPKQAPRASVSIAGIATPRWVMIGVQGIRSVFAAGVTDLNATIQLNNENARILSGYCKVTFDAAGLAAWAGKTIRFRSRYYSESGTAAYNIAIVDVALGAALSYEVFMVQQMSLRDLVVPSPLSLALTITDITGPGAAWPANSVLEGTVSAIIQARHAQLPG